MSIAQSIAFNKIKTIALPWRSGNFVYSLCLLGICLLCALCVGVVPISLAEVWQWICGEGTAQTNMVLGQLRLPRALLALSVGALLAVCGAMTQTLFRNPLADPSLIGISSGASLGACVAIVAWPMLTSVALGATGVAIGAFMGALSVVSLVYGASWHLRANLAGGSLLLLGLAITFLVGSVTGFLEFVAEDPMLRRLSLWRMGALYQADYWPVLLCFSILVFVLSMGFFLQKRLDAFLLGESQARALGVDVTWLKRGVFICVSLGVGTAVACTGMIAFVGLIIPHIVRLFFQAHHGVLLPYSAIYGALLLLVSDMLGRTLLMPVEIPVGLLTPLIGAPVLLMILKRTV